MKRRIVTPQQKAEEDRLIRQWLERSQPTRPAASVGMIDELENLKQSLKRRIGAREKS